MKKTLLVVMAVLVSVTFVTTVFAASTTQTTTDKAATDTAKDKAKAATEKPVAAPAAEKKVEKKEPAPKTHQFTGEVTAIDTKAKTLSAKKQKEEKAFDIANAKMKAEPKVGDKVLVKYIEKDGKNLASSATITKKASAKKEEVKKEAPKAAVAPATPAAPAAPAKK